MNLSVVPTILPLRRSPGSGKGVVIPCLVNLLITSGITCHFSTSGRNLFLLGYMVGYSIIFQGVGIRLTKPCNSLGSLRTNLLFPSDTLWHTLMSYQFPKQNPKRTAVMLNNSSEIKSWLKNLCPSFFTPYDRHTRCKFLKLNHIQF